MSWLGYASKTRSTKIALAHLYPRRRWKEWTSLSGTVYEAFPEFFVSSVAIPETTLTQAPISPGLNQWAYDATSGRLLINVGSDPTAQDVVLTYKLFYGSSPLALPHDLASGSQVEYDARIQDVGELKLELDYENAGIALESNSQITLSNGDGFFDAIFDTLVWENQRAVFYSYGLELAPSDARVIFDGFIENKSFSTQAIKFTLKDQFKRLRETINLPVFSSLDGDITDDTISKPKRRIYGRMRQLDCTGIDKTKSGYTLTGSFLGLVGTSTVTGTGSLLLSEASPEDEIVFSVSGETFKYKIQSVDSDTQATLSELIEAPILSSLSLSPAVPYRGKNREWHIAGHLCHDISTTVTGFISPTRIQVASTDGMCPGDLLDYENGSQFVNIERISGATIVLDQAIAGVPVGGESVVIPAVRAANLGTSSLVAGRDYTVTNGASDCKIVLSDLAEFNVTRPTKTPATFTFTNGSRTITHALADFDLTTVLRPRDWIRADSITRPTWFEVLSVEATSLEIRVPFSEVSFVGTAERKNVVCADDSSLVTVDVTGKRGEDGRWITSASQAIFDIVDSDLSITAVNTAAFTAAELDAPQMLSYAIPKQILGGFPVIRDVITDINKSVFGALYQDKDFLFTFSVLQSDKDEDIYTILEDDVISYSSNSKPNIANRVRVNYRPFVDTETGRGSFSVKEFQNGFVDNLSQIKNTVDATAFLFDDIDAEIYAERLGFLRSLTNTNVSIKGKINLNRFGLASKVMVNFSRFFTRYGQEGTRKIGLVYGISTDEANSTLSINDFNGMFTRVPAIAPDTSSDYSGAGQEDIAKWGYIVDNETETPDGVTNKSLGNNLIG